MNQPEQAVETLDTVRVQKLGTPPKLGWFDPGVVELQFLLPSEEAVGLFTAPADLEFERHLQSVPLRVHLGLYQDETAVQCHWHVPEAHFLESWGDARAFDGTVWIIQPLIAPLYGGRSASELLTAFEGEAERPGHEIVRVYWASRTTRLQWWRVSVSTVCWRRRCRSPRQARS